MVSAALRWTATARPGSATALRRGLQVRRIVDGAGHVRAYLIVHGNVGPERLTVDELQRPSL
jgi:hypothetical protein